MRHIQYLKRYSPVFLLFFTPIVSIAQINYEVSTSPLNRDTVKYATTGYIGLNFGIIFIHEYQGLKSFALAGAMPIKKSHFGISGKIGYGNEDYSYSRQLVNDIYALAGGFMTFTLSAHYAFDFKLMAGAVYSNYPAFTYTTNNVYNYNKGTNTTDSVVYYNTSVQNATGFSFVFQGGIGFRYMIAAHLGLMINVDYTYRSAVHQYISSVTDHATANTFNTQNSTSSNTTYSLPPVTTTSSTIYNTYEGFAIISLGIHYQFGNAILIAK